MVIFSRAGIRREGVNGNELRIHQHVPDPVEHVSDLERNRNAKRSRPTVPRAPMITTLRSHSLAGTIQAIVLQRTSGAGT